MFNSVQRKLHLDQVIPLQWPLLMFSYLLHSEPAVLYRNSIWHTYNKSTPDPNCIVNIYQPYLISNYIAVCWVLRFFVYWLFLLTLHFLNECYYKNKVHLLLSLNVKQHIWKYVETTCYEEAKYLKSLIFSKIKCMEERKYNLKIYLHK